MLGRIRALKLVAFTVGTTPQFTAGLATTSTVTDDTAVGTTLLTVVATDPGDTLTLTLQSTTPASTAFNFDPASGISLPLNLFHSLY